MNVGWNDFGVKWTHTVLTPSIVIETIILFHTAAGESYPNNQNVNQAECEASVYNSAGQPVNNLPTAGNYLLSSQGVTSQNSHQINGTNCFVCPTSMSSPEVSHKHNADHVSNPPRGWATIRPKRQFIPNCLIDQLITNLLKVETKGIIEWTTNEFIQPRDIN